MKVTLNQGETVIAAIVGVMRYLEAMVKDREDDTVAYSGEADCKLGFGQHIVGALAEHAWAKITKAFWNTTIGRIDASDFGEIEIKAIVQQHHRLMVKEQHETDKFYILAYVAAPTANGTLVDFIGYLHGQHIKTAGNFDTTVPKPCYCVTQSKLKRFKADK